MDERGGGYEEPIPEPIPEPEQPPIFEECTGRWQTVR